MHQLLKEGVLIYLLILLGCCVVLSKFSKDK